MITTLLLLGGLVVPLIGAVGAAIRRSTRRQDSARHRDRLVDAARSGQLDLADHRVFSLIDWLDRVAITGRTAGPGRHAPDAPGPAGSLARSLAATLLAPDALSPVTPSWPEPVPPNAGADLLAAAVRYRQHHQRRHRLRSGRPPAPRSRPPLPAPIDPSTSLAAEIFAVAGPEG